MWGGFLFKMISHSTNTHRLLLVKCSVSLFLQPEVSKALLSCCHLGSPFILSQTRTFRSCHKTSVLFSVLILIPLLHLAESWLLDRISNMLIQQESGILCEQIETPTTKNTPPPRKKTHSGKRQLFSASSAQRVKDIRRFLLMDSLSSFVFGT